MAKDVNYKVGDIFEIPLENSKRGYGKILLINSPIIFCEFYDVDTSRQYSIRELKEQSPVLSIWCANHGIKNREWIIQGNIPLEGDLKIPYLLKKDILNPKKVFLVPGEYFMKPDEEAHTIESTEDKTSGAQPYGVFGDVAAKLRYTHELKRTKGML